ncbi:response Regulator Receiver Signal Transduction Histidine Kinase [Fulvivirga imtechensis AK7]|uniref:histidine kinase n=1 Tax=Fulvivirga imtechensis AK7 TaxID=1237149 RepID=L8K0D5_9BACT|nr:PAS domain-containing sensor histidine kinase [Fulvivirga imtechensis]ELR73858.1 response Regulator Receiver Signal Transduction Histidine Kinase [Fulvivirga imtechensis AK7]
MSKEVESLKAEIDRLKAIINRDHSAIDDQTFKDLFDNSSDLIYIHDENGIFIDVNKAVLEKYGYSKEEVIGQTPQMLSVAGMNDLDDVVAKTKIVWTGGPAQSLEWWSRRKDNTMFLKELILRKGKYFGREVIVATGRDITERKRVENELRNKNEELKNLNEALDAFVYSASHDLKAPLLSIKGLVGLMKVDKETNPNYYLEKINQSIQKLTSFVNDLVEYSRNTRTEVKVEGVDFREFIDEVFSNFEFLPDDRQVYKDIEIDQVHDFYTDRYRLYVILNNLVSNAIRYSDKEKGQSFIHVKVHQEKSKVMISVSDNGIGIAKAHAGKIFQMFYRGTDVKTGSGLGLYIVKETLNKLQGHITYTSEPGQGTTFVVELPNLKGMTNI